MRVSAGSPAASHVFACLVHERPDVVVDLVCNLRALEPDASIVLYDGSRTGGLLASVDVPFDDGVLIHPIPRPMRWGRLHDFAIDCMRLALQELDFEALTIVDSDQLLIRRGFAQSVSATLAARPQIGMLGNAPGPQPRTSRIDPVRYAWRKSDQWRRFLSSYPGGVDAFPHWTFWPSTVFSRDAASALVESFDEPALKRLMSATRIWATEEIVLPTLVAALGFEVATSPASFDYVRYRRPYSPADITAALARPDIFWIHPIPRSIDDPLRAQIRHAHHGYGRESTSRERARRQTRRRTAVPTLTEESASAANEAGKNVAASIPPLDPVVLAAPPEFDRLIDAIVPIAGWLEVDEARLLAAAATHALRATAGLPIVEIGSYAGRGTVLLASIAKRHQPAATVYAIDRFDGVVGEAGRKIYRTGTTLADFKRNIAGAGVAETVEVVVAYPATTAWTRQVGLLVVDALHDYANVSADFRRYEAWLSPHGLVAFHDYAPYYPGVMRFVDELLGSGRYDEAARAGSLIVLRPRSDSAIEPQAIAPDPASWVDDSSTGASGSRRARPPRPPLISCIMPTFNRRAHVPAAIQQFLTQDYPERELLVIDDGSDSIEDLIPDDDRVRYIRLRDRLTIGAKRNLGCELASGDILAHWDDDDWVASWRLRYQVDALLASDAEIVGLSTLLYYDHARGQAWRYQYRGSGQPWVHDPTFCYRREIWQADRFPDTNFGLDTRYLRSGRRKRVQTLADHRFYVGTIHPGNTSPKNTREASWTPIPVGEVRDLMSGDESRRSHTGNAADGAMQIAV